MKISRRTVVKGLGTGIFSTALASQASGISPSLTSQNTDNPATDDTLRVQIAHRWGADSIVAVIKNTSDHSATITDINSVATDYGRFNFSDLTKYGPLTLTSGEEIHVPFTVMGTPVKPYGHFDNRLQKHLKRSLKIATTSQSTQVTTSLNPKVV